MKQRGVTSINLGDLQERLQACVERSGVKQSEIIRAGMLVAITHLEGGGSLETLGVPSPVTERLDSIERIIRDSGKHLDRAKLSEMLELAEGIIHQARELLKK